jgi:hypothetical protein
MKKYFRLSAILALVSALTIGALSSALWELLLKPLLAWITTLTLNIATLGINSLRDDLYAEIAKGIYDRSGHFLLTGLTVGGAVIFTGLAIAVPLTAWRGVLKRVRRRNLLNAGGVSKGSQKSHPPSQQFRQIRWLLIAFVAVSLYEVAFLVVTYVRQDFISSATVYLDQSQRVIGPFLTDDQRVLLRSRVARMKTRADFDSVNGDIVKVAETNNVALPKFVPF